MAHVKLLILQDPHPPAPWRATGAEPSCFSHEEGFSIILGCNTLNSLSGEKKNQKNNTLSDAFGWFYCIISTEITPLLLDPFRPPSSKTHNLFLNIKPPPVGFFLSSHADVCSCVKVRNIFLFEYLAEETSYFMGCNLYTLASKKSISVGCRAGSVLEKLLTDSGKCWLHYLSKLWPKEHAD